MKLVKAALAAGYIVVIAVGCYVSATMRGATLAQMAVHPYTVGASALWALVWVALTRYLSRITAVGDRMTLGPRARTSGGADAG